MPNLDLTMPTVRNWIGHNLTSWIAGEGIPDPTSPYSVQETYNNERDSVRGKRSGIGFQGALRTPSVLSTDNFEQHDLETLRTKVDKIDIAAVGDLSSAWGKIGTQEITSLTTFQQAMTKATSEGTWTGEASKAASQAVADHATQATAAAKAAELTGNKLAELNTGLDPTKKLVPHVPEHRTGWNNFRHLIAGRGWKNDDVAYHNAYAEAKRVLSTVYAPVVHESDQGVPVIPKPNENQPKGPGDQPTPGPGPGPGPGTGNKVTGYPVGGGDDPTKNQNPDQNPNSQDPNSQTPQSNSPEQSGESPNAGDQGPTTPAAATNAAGFDPTSMGGGAGTPGGLGGGLGGGTGSGVPAGHGSAVPGTVGINAAGNAARAAGAGKAGTSGMPGMGGMGRGGKGEKEDERTKKVADYLINQENGDELTGIPSLPKTIPPVIGE
ncbi:hypothetical protein [Nocardia nova]|nr:hypothetical protein [Nocardia nova]